MWSRISVDLGMPRTSLCRENRFQSRSPRKKREKIEDDRLERSTSFA